MGQVSKRDERQFLKDYQLAPLTYIIGNHDEAIRQLLPLYFGGEVDVVNELIYHTVDGRKLLVLHGDIFDQIVKYARWLAFLGDMGYSLLLRTNSLVNFARRITGRPPWSLSAYAKRTVKTAANYIGKYEETIRKEASIKQVDGVVSGHIHHAELRDEEFFYANTGDWVESLTAIAEDHKGKFWLLRYGQKSPKKHFRTIFISDVHLGSRGCQADALLVFLHDHKADHIVLVGDIIDLWKINARSMLPFSRIYFPPSHMAVIRKLLKRAI